MGENDRLREGDRLSVYRGNRKIAIVEVEKLYDSFSAATILKEDENAPIEVGDVIRKV